jgi:hypothetical protein
MTDYTPMRNLPAAPGYKKGDLFVLFGELFGRGYANGIVDEARRAGMTVVGATVGRRDNGGELRPLNDQELAEAEANLGGKIINIPLEAGFDLEPAGDGLSPVERLKGIKPDDWESAKFGEGLLEDSRQRGAERFIANLERFVAELTPLVPAGGSLLFAHTMAGGIPRTRLFMPLLNRIFKGTGDKFLPSEPFWNSDLGRLCQLNFNEVTGNTFGRLLESTAAIRAGVEAQGGSVRYVAYGYHGCGVLLGGEYVWQSYTPYVQGEAKMLLEDIAVEAIGKGITAAVYNCPEIQTNSSALFLGVELSLYPFLTALEHEGGGPVAEQARQDCESLLKEGETLERMLTRAEEYLTAPLMAKYRDFAAWPQHNGKEEMAFMLERSQELMAMSADQKRVVCAELSRLVFQGVGRLMFDDSWAPQGSVLWLNHDIIARRLLS